MPNVGRLLLAGVDVVAGAPLDELEVRAHGLGVPTHASQIAVPGPDRDQFTNRRLVASHRQPASVVVPEVRDLAPRSGIIQVPAIPELNRGRAVPLAPKIEAEPERVLNRPERGRPD